MNMTTGTHGAQQPGQGIHVIHAFTPANAAALTSLPVTAEDIGKVALQLDTREFLVLSGVSPDTWHTLTGGPSSMFGAHYQYVEDTTLHVLPSGQNMDTCLSAALLGMTSGSYRADWTVVWAAKSTQKDFLLDIQVDGTIPLIDPGNGGILREEPKDAGTDQRYLNSGSRDFHLSSGNHTVTIDYGSSSAATTRVFYSNFRIHRVA